MSSLHGGVNWGSLAHRTAGGRGAKTPSQVLAASLTLFLRPHTVKAGKSFRLLRPPFGLSLRSCIALGMGMWVGAYGTSDLDFPSASDTKCAGPCMGLV